MRGVPFLKLLVLERVARRVAGARQNVIAHKRVEQRFWLYGDGHLTIGQQDSRGLSDRFARVSIRDRRVGRCRGEHGEVIQIVLLEAEGRGTKRRRTAGFLLVCGNEAP